MSKPLKFDVLVRLAKRVYLNGVSPDEKHFVDTLDEAIRTALREHADELCANDLQLFMEMLDEDERPTDLWFVPNPMPYIDAIMLPRLRARLKAHKQVQEKMLEQGERDKPNAPYAPTRP